MSTIRYEIEYGDTAIEDLEHPLGSGRRFFDARSIQEEDLEDDL